MDGGMVTIWPLRGQIVLFSSVYESLLLFFSALIKGIILGLLVVGCFADKVLLSSHCDVALGLVKIMQGWFIVCCFAEKGMVYILPVWNGWWTYCLLRSLAEPLGILCFVDFLLSVIWVVGA